MIYIIACEGVQDMERRRLLENAKLSLDETQAINNLGIVGVKLSNGSGTKKETGKYSYWGSHANDVKKTKKGGEQQESYDLSRYIPLVKRVMEVRLTSDSALQGRKLMYKNRTKHEMIYQSHISRGSMSPLPIFNSRIKLPPELLHGIIKMVLYPQMGIGRTLFERRDPVGSRRLLETRDQGPAPQRINRRNPKRVVRQLLYSC